MCLSTFSNDNQFMYEEVANINLRRNFLSLFDSMKNEVVRLDVTLGVSLVERVENEKLKGKLESIRSVRIEQRIDIGGIQDYP